MPVPVALAPNRSLLALFVAVVLAVIVTQVLLSGAAFRPALESGVAAGVGATAITWVLDRREA